MHVEKLNNRIFSIFKECLCNRTSANVLRDLHEQSMSKVQTSYNVEYNFNEFLINEFWNVSIYVRSVSCN